MNRKKQSPPGATGGHVEMIFPGRTIKRENNEKSFDLQDLRREYLSRRCRLSPGFAAVVAPLFFGEARNG